MAKGTFEVSLLKKSYIVMHINLNLNFWYISDKLIKSYKVAEILLQHALQTKVFFKYFKMWMVCMLTYIYVRTYSQTFLSGVIRMNN